MSGKNTALVTGASSGIGRAIAELLSERGFGVFGTMRRPVQTGGKAGPHIPDWCKKYSSSCRSF